MSTNIKPATINDDSTYTVKWPDDSADVFLVAHYSGKKFGVTQRNKANG